MSAAGVMAYLLTDPVKVRMYQRLTEDDIASGKVDGIPWAGSLRLVSSFKAYDEAIEWVRASLPDIPIDHRICIDERPHGEVLQIWHLDGRWVDSGRYA